MNFCFLFALSNCVNPGKVEILDFMKWNELVENGKDGKPWFIMFSATGLLTTPIFMRVMANASDIADGLINFGFVDDYRTPGLSKKYGFKTIPSFIMLNKEKSKEYKGKKTEDEILKHISKFVIDKTLFAKEKWLTSKLDSAVLFTDKLRTPSIWAGVSSHFNGNVKIGVSNSTELLKKYGGKKFPSIFMHNSTHTEMYNGPVSYGNIVKTLEEFMRGEYERPYLFINDYYLPDEFYDQVGDTFTGFCVISATDKLHEGIADAKDSHQGKKYKFFVGSESLPFKFININETWIIHPIQKRAMKVDSPEQTSKALDSIIDGTAKWIKYETNEL